MSHIQKILKMLLMGKMSRNWANGQNIYDSGKKVTPWVHLFLTLSHTYMYMTIIVKPVYWYVSQISDERSQDHWSSGFKE